MGKRHFFFHNFSSAAGGWMAIWRRQSQKLSVFIFPWWYPAPTTVAATTRMMWMTTRRWHILCSCKAWQGTRVVTFVPLLYILHNQPGSYQHTYDSNGFRHRWWWLAGWLTRWRSVETTNYGFSTLAVYPNARLSVWQHHPGMFH